MTTTETKSRPIIFSGEMVKAILAGRKTQTRRVVKPQPVSIDALDHDEESDGPAQTLVESGRLRVSCLHGSRAIEDSRLCPYHVGDQLWVREKWQVVGEDSLSHCTGPDDCYYAADDRGMDGPLKWRSPIHMPRYASRITLEITDVRVERVQDIDELDALDEGVIGERIITGTIKEAGKPPRTGEFVDGMARDGYAALWDRINGKKHPWSENPWVWAISFRKI